MEGSLSARWMTCLGFSLRCDRVAKVVQSRIANYFQIFPPLVFSYRLFIFTNRGNFQVRTWRQFAAENRVNFQRRDWTGVKWSSQSRKTNFLTLPDLAFGFVHKRSGNEITASFTYVDYSSSWTRIFTKPSTKRAWWHPPMDWIPYLKIAWEGWEH